MPATTPGSPIWYSLRSMKPRIPRARKLFVAVVSSRPTAAVSVHTCFWTCDVTFDEGMRNLLLEPPPYPAFQAWFHGAVLDFMHFDIV